MDFAKSIFENTGRMPLVCAHRGSSAGNIPCNTLAALTRPSGIGRTLISTVPLSPRNRKLLEHGVSAY